MIFSLCIIFIYYLISFLIIITHTYVIYTFYETNVQCVFISEKFLILLLSEDPFLLILDESFVLGELCIYNELIQSASTERKVIREEHEYLHSFIND